MQHNIPPYGTGSSTNITTELIQKYLDENKHLILAILDNQNMGKLSECATYQAKLQQNLMYLAAIADAQPYPYRATASHHIHQISQMGQMGQTSQPSCTFQTPQFLAPQPLAALPPMPTPTIKHEFMPPAEHIMNQRIASSTLGHIQTSQLQASQMQASQQAFYNQQTSMMMMSHERGMRVPMMASPGYQMASPGSRNQMIQGDVHHGGSGTDHLRCGACSGDQPGGHGQGSDGSSGSGAV